MSLISGTLTFPLLPVRALVALARTVQEQAERERSSPASLRRKLEAVEQQYADDTDPRSAQEEAEEVERTLGQVVQPAPVLPDRAAGADGAGDS